MRLDRHAGI